MSESITVTLKNSHREPLEDTSRILVYRQRDRRLVGETTINKRAKVEFKGLADEVHIVRAFPTKHRPCARFARPGAHVSIHCPVKPENVRQLHIYGMSAIEPFVRNLSEKVEEKDLHKEELASALNIWAKLKATRLGDGTAADYVRQITRIHRDRIYFRTDQEMLELARNADGADFVSVSGTFHKIEGWRVVQSLKTRDLYGNLQLTFLEGAGGELQVDADIDEASGLLHLFEVLRNALTDETHPYDIHEVLAFHQELDTGYRLIV